ncbi:putative zinc finger BED domain-containing protein 6-like, partial [Triplophysa rosa]
LLMKDSQPFTLVEDEGFREFDNKLCSAYKTSFKNNGGRSQGPGHESCDKQPDSRYVDLDEYGRQSCSHMPFLK